MSEVVAELRRFAFENSKLHRIETDVDPRNEA
jgi:RimJ/RimL family protein N-acetyltransferase